MTKFSRLSRQGGARRKPSHGTAARRAPGGGGGGSPACTWRRSAALTRRWLSTESLPTASQTPTQAIPAAPDSRKIDGHLPRRAWG